MSAKLTAERRSSLNRKRIAIILGNLIIVGTFIMRDVLRDSLRENLDVVHTAQIAYVSRFDVTTVLAQMMDFTGAVNGFMHRTEFRETKTEASEDEKLRYEFEKIFQRISTERTMLQNDETLVKGIDQHWGEYWELRNDSDATEKAFLQIENRTDESAHQKTLDVLKVRVTEDPLLEKIAALGQRAWEDSEALSDRLGKRYRYINYAFYALFPIGVFVNIWGALSGLEIEQDSL